MSGSCAEWLRLIAAYRAGQQSNEGAISAEQERAEVDDRTRRESDDDVADELQRWNRKS